VPEPIASRKAAPLLEGMVYDFLTVDDTLYPNATLLDLDETGVWIQYRGATVFIAEHELADAT
jgi:hypothetical protein